MIEARYFGLPADAVSSRVGNHLERFTARALTDEIFERGATGGTTTALVHYLLGNTIIDAVLHLGSEHEHQYICHHGRPVISTRPEETFRACRSKCQLSPLLQDLKKMSGYKRFAVVGLSCHTAALRKLQAMRENPVLKSTFPVLTTRADQLVGNLAFVIGVNCFSSTRHGGIDRIYEKLGVREEDVIKHAETTKKTVYQQLSEGKNFLWFVQDGLMTRDGRYHPFSYSDFIEDTVAMGCMVCPSFIVCKEADVSIGVTASDNKLNEFGYNSVFVRNRELSGVLKNMVEEGKLLRRPMWENRGRLLRKFVERMIPSKDAIGIADYVRTGSWQHSADTLKQSSSAQGGSSGKVMGLQRLLLTQTVKRKIMYEPATGALRNAGKFLTDIF
jgi:coenzyme F420-reducing hydrogenase beta subunit